MQITTTTNLLIGEQKTNEPYPPYALGNVTKHVAQFDTHAQTQYIPGQHNDSINKPVSPTANK